MHSIEAECNSQFSPAVIVDVICLRPPHGSRPSTYVAWIMWTTDTCTWVVHITGGHGMCGNTDITCQFRRLQMRDGTSVLAGQ